jgi:capsular polysaccharide biosynthesis protein
MPERIDSKAVEGSCRIFRRLLVVYPKAHRDEYGAAISQLFRDQCRDAWAAARTRGLIVFWLRALSDLLKTSIAEHLSNLNRMKFMLTGFRPTFKPWPQFLRISALIFGAIFLGSLLVTFLTPNTYVGTARVHVEDIPPPSEYETNFQQIEFEIIKSHAVLEKVVKAMNLEEVWGKKYNRGLLAGSKAESMIKKRFELIPIRDTKYIEIRAFSHNPQEAANLANAIASAYREYWEEQRIRNASEAPKETIHNRVVRFMDLAVADPRPIRPNRPLNIVLGALAGIFACLIVAPMILGIVATLRKNEIPPLICSTGKEI